MADFLDEKRNEIGARLAELKPLVDEHHRLAAAAEAIDGVAPVSRNGGEPVTPSKPVARDRPKKGTGGRRGRPKGSGVRGAEALALVKTSPGITIPEMAEKMGIKQNYLYRVLPALAEDGLVGKYDRGWYPTAAAKTA